ncbi:glycoside hydrolase family 1 protein [Mesoplasma chauliocola]|uniref:Glycoside hydrolase family 1 protein n=1 Tax=Mesoplasma chauliocola TaxID=216427 RepID=A0A249SMF4_9MOLU|nr:glycoside hydrolase family 1 protein [Mesoplasma chauliocola]ASZ08793.1 glycoside hydrolase family 1 protein [Mesoplasma chauliocola]
MKFIKDDFLWGGATSAGQIEGAWNKNMKSPTLLDVSPFNSEIDRKEMQISSKTKNEYLKNLEVIEDYKFPKRLGINFYDKYKEDIALFKEAGMNIYRMSIAWSRIFPNGNEQQPNVEGLQFYKNVFEECKKNGLKIMVTMQHFDVPIPIMTKYGGWVNKKVIDLYLKYAEVLFKEFYEDVDFWLPFNEIDIAIWAPELGIGIFKSDYSEDQKSLVSASYQGLHNQFVAQAKTIELAKKISDKIKIGCMLANSTTYAIDCKPENVMENLKMQQFSRWFYYDVMARGEYPKYIKRHFSENNILLDITSEELEIIKNNTIEYITFSYYMTGTVSKDKIKKANANLHDIGENPFLESTEWGWQIDPIGLRITLNEIWDRYQLPIFISENGIGVVETLNSSQTVEDDYRIKYLKEHIIQINEALKDGVDVFGYTMWTPIDVVSASTCEMSKRYGLIFVDYDDYHNGTGKRFKKKSYHWFQNFMKTKEL